MMLDLQCGAQCSNVVLEGFYIFLYVLHISVCLYISSCFTQRECSVIL